jgi:hypothetical protein
MTISSNIIIKKNLMYFSIGLNNKEEFYLMNKFKLKENKKNLFLTKQLKSICILGQKSIKINCLN